MLKNAIDYVGPEWHKKPVGFISYGGVGGARVIEQLRQVVIDLHMHPLKQAIHMPVDVVTALKGQPVPADPALFAPLKSEKANRVKALIDDLLWWGRALKTAREQGK